MVNAISSVPSTNSSNVRAMDKVSQEQLYSPGLYNVNELLEPPHRHREQGSFLGFLFKVALATAIVGGVAAFARKKTSFADFSLENPKGLVRRIKVKFAQFGDFVNNKILSKIFKKSGGDNTPPHSNPSKPVPEGGKNN